MFTLNALFAWWWLALPSLLLPLWWHRQRQKQKQVFPLASAQFLANAEPQTVQVWRWRDLILLLLRLAILLCLIALLAQFIRGQRGDTVFVSNKANTTWIAAQLAQLKQQSKSIEVLKYCEQASCDIQTNSIFAWLEQHQAQWKDSSRWYLLAAEGELTMPAQAPRFEPAFELRIAPTMNAISKPLTSTAAQTLSVYLQSPRADEWRKWFQVFEVSAKGQWHFVFDEVWHPAVQLIVWEQDSTPAPDLKAPLWWTNHPALLQSLQSKSGTTSSVTSDLQLQVSAGGFGLQQFKQFETPRGRVWLADQRDWPLHHDDSVAAWQLFDAWRAIQTTNAPLPAVPYQSRAIKEVQKQLQKQVQDATQANATIANRFGLSPASEVGQSLPSEWETILLSLFLLFFLCERVLHHARRQA